MVRNKFGGNKHKKKANKSNSAAPRGLRLKDSDDQEYAKVGKPLGSSRFKLVVYSDGSEKIGTVCGSMHKRVWIREGDVVLISNRSCNSSEKGSEKVDIIHKYQPEEAKKLERNGELKKALEEAKEEVTGVTFTGDVSDGSGDESDNDIEDFLSGI